MSNDRKDLVEDNFINVNEYLPNISMKVKWIYVDGIKDIGWYNKETDDFYTIDPCSNSKEITHWKPFKTNQS